MEGFSTTSAETFNHYKPSPAQHHKRYNVFLSFRAADVRNTLVDYLFNSLSTAGFNVFVDSEILDEGKNTGVSLEEIRDSTVHIPIFSADYARSPGCLDELSHMWNCKSTIIPLFYNVKPSDVREPDKKGPYAKAFKEHRETGTYSEEKMDAWKEALREISLLSGWSLAETAGGYEDRLVKLVVMDLLKTLNIAFLHVAKHPEGLSDRIEEVTTLLKMGGHSRDVVCVAIWGTGGLGKTTLAKAVYNKIHDEFEASCFVSDVRASTEESDKGLLNLQKQILSDLAQVNGLKLNSVEDGKIQMQKFLGSKKALVIVDDVDQEEQLDGLVGDAVNGYWFGPGSRIIITTGDSRALKRHNVILYRMTGLNREESEKLFCWHAFLRVGPAEGYEHITQKIVNACHGSPLLLEAVGARLYGEKNLEIWNEALTKLVTGDLYGSLKISYDALSREEQRIFLDIACFFPGSPCNMDFYVELWRDLKCSAPRTCLRNLESKSLIRIDEDRSHSFFWMHDHIRDMGRWIIEEEFRNNKDTGLRRHGDLVKARLKSFDLRGLGLKKDHSSIATPMGASVDSSAQSSLDFVHYIRGLTAKASVFNWGVITFTLGSYGLSLSTRVFWLCWSILVPEAAVIFYLIQPYWKWKWIESAMPAQTAGASEDSKKPHRPSDHGRAGAVFLKVGMSLALIAMLIYLEDLSQRQNKTVLFVGLSIILLEGFPAILRLIRNGLGKSITEGQDWKVLNFFTPSVINAMIVVTGGIVLGGDLGSLMREKPYWTCVSIVVVDLIAEAVHQSDYGNRSDSIPKKKPRMYYIVIVLRLMVVGSLCYCMTKEISQKSYFGPKVHAAVCNPDCAPVCDVKCQKRSKSLLITMVFLGGLQAAETFTTALFIIYKFLWRSTSASQTRVLRPSTSASQSPV